MIYKFNFEVLPPNHNEWIGMNRYARTPFKQQWQSLAEHQKREQNWAEPLPLSRCGIVWRMFVQRRRDIDNQQGMLKPVLDGLRYAGVIKNDSPVVVEWILPEQALCGTDPEMCELELWTGSHHDLMKKILKEVYAEMGRLRTSERPLTPALVSNYVMQPLFQLAEAKRRR